MTEFPSGDAGPTNGYGRKANDVVMRSGNNGCGDPSGKRLVVEFVSRAHSLSDENSQ